MLYNIKKTCTLGLDQDFSWLDNTCKEVTVMRPRIRAFALIGACALLPGCIAAVPLLVGAVTNGLVIGGAVGHMNAQDRACASMSPVERQRASVQDRVNCERAWAQTGPNCARADQRIANWCEESTFFLSTSLRMRVISPPEGT